MDLAKGAMLAQEVMLQTRPPCLVLGGTRSTGRYTALDQGFFLLRQNTRTFHAIWSYFRPFFVFSSNLRDFSSNLSNFEIIMQKIAKKIPKLNNLKVFKNLQIFHKNPK